MNSPLDNKWTQAVKTWIVSEPTPPFIEQYTTLQSMLNVTNYIHDTTFES